MATSRKSFGRLLERSKVHIGWLATYCDYFLKKTAGRGDDLEKIVQLYAVSLKNTLDLLDGIGEVGGWLKNTND